MNWLAIINPNAGGHTEAYWQRLTRELSEKLAATCVHTQYPHHASDLVLDSPAYDGYIAVGGDGTIAEVANALPEAASLAFLPAGTGNGLARDLGLLDPATAFRAMQRPRFEMLDWITVHWQGPQTAGQRRVISSSALGYVAETTALSFRKYRRLGILGHCLSAFLQTFRQRDFALRMRLDGGPWQEQQLTNFVIHNSQYIGSFRLFPEAVLNDGRMNLLYGRLPGALQLTEDLGILTQSYFFKRSVRAQATRVEVEAAEPILLMLDGDLIEGVQTVQFQLEPSRLACCTGEILAPLTSAVSPDQRRASAARVVEAPAP